MEVIVRAAVPDRPGALAQLAAAFAEAGADIQAIDVIESQDGVALDDLVCVVEPDALATLVERLRALDGVDLVHVGPSRGLPGNAVNRLALGLESLLNGAMDRDHAVQTLVGGILRATSAEFAPADEAPRTTEKTLVVGIDHRVLVIRRDYRFTDAEAARAMAIASVCVEASRAAGAIDRSR